MRSREADSELASTSLAGLKAGERHSVTPTKAMQTRRTFLRNAATVSLGAFVPRTASLAAKVSIPPLVKFVDPLIAALPKLTPGAHRRHPGADYYEIYMAGGRWQFSSQLPVTAPGSAPTTWGYGSESIFLGYLGPMIEARRGTPVVVTFMNLLDPTVPHPLQTAIDPTVPNPALEGILPAGRATPHLHGGFTDPRFDGHPQSWWTQDGTHGTHYGTLAGALPGEAVYRYSNEQPAATLWYHDHAMGITRLNVYAGLAGLYILRDELDTGRADNPLRLPSGDYEIPLVIQDKQFNPDGSLYYPNIGVTPAHPNWVPEFFGDTAVVNGRAFPFLNVEPRRYRFRIVNGAQARFFNLAIEGPGRGNLPFWVIGMEQGLLSGRAVPLSSLLLGPGERADVVVDFIGAQAGARFTLTNDAATPFPGSGKPGASDLPHVMQFRIVEPANGAMFDSSLPAASLVLPTRVPLTTSRPPRPIVLKETMDPLADAPVVVLLNERWFDDPAGTEEMPLAGSTEIWEWVNLTEDAHPMHMHLVRFQVVNRQAIDAEAYAAAYSSWIQGGRNPATKPSPDGYLIGAPRPPLPEESGFKDTVKAWPGEVTRIISTFDLPTGVPGDADYIYHCHILEHEDNEMMRPFRVVRSQATR